MEYVSQEEFNRVAHQFDVRRAAIDAANKQLAQAKTLQQKIDAKRMIAVAVNSNSVECRICGEAGHPWQRCPHNL